MSDLHKKLLAKYKGDLKLPDHALTPLSIFEAVFDEKCI